MKRIFKINVFSILAGLCLFLLSPASQAADTGWLSPTQNLAGPLFDGFETNPAGAYASGGLVAQDTRAGGSGSRGDEHRYYGFNLSAIPDSDSITGIEVKLSARKISSNEAAMDVMISKSGLNTWTGATLTTGDLTTTLADHVLGSSSELWGLGATLGAALKTSGAFVIKIQNTSGNNSGKTWQLDWIQVRVYYGTVPDLTIAKAHAGNFTQGQTGAPYTITVGNSGTGPTAGTVTVTDTLPAGLTPTGASGNGWTYTLTSPSTCTFTRSDALAAGNTYPAINLTVDVASNTRPSVTNTAVVSGGGESNTANNTATDPTTIIQLVPNLVVTKTVRDENGGNLRVGEEAEYTILIQNPTDGYLMNAQFTDAIPVNTTFVAGSTIAPPGSTVVSESPTFTITGINVPPRSLQLISFCVLVTGGTSISNQGSVAFDTNGDGSNDGTQLTDGDTTLAGDQATTIPVIPLGTFSPNFDQTTKRVAMMIDLDNSLDISSGDTLRYTVVIPNTGDQNAVGTTFADSIPANTTYVAGSAAATSGTASYNGGLNRIDWTGNINAGDSVTVRFNVTVNGSLAPGTLLSNQGTVNYDSDNNGSLDSTMLTDSNLYEPGRQPTDVRVQGLAHGIAVMSVTDENGGNLGSGDTLLYTITFENQSGIDVNGIAFTDAIPGNTTYIPGSATAPAGAVIVTENPILYITGIDMPAHSQKTFSFRVTVNTLGAGVEYIMNQGTVFYDLTGDGINDSIQLTDGDVTQSGNQPTLIPVSVGSNFDLTTKSAALSIDADANQFVTPGDTLRYNIKIRNTGTIDTVGTQLTDSIPSFTTYAGFVAATSGVVSYNAGLNRIEWTGDVIAGAAAIIVEFDVTVNALTPLGTVIINQGSLHYDSDGIGGNDSTILTDGDYTTPGRQTTNVTLGGFAHGFGTKTATDINGGNLEPGDIILYTIEIHNESGYYGSNLQFHDTIPNNTTFISGSVTRPAGSTIATETPVLDITGIDVPPYSVATISFRVKVDAPLPSGITQISNQATVFYDSNTDGTNDAQQSTDGDLNEVGNQPTVSTLYTSSISGTVFDDNGAGGGTAGNGAQDGTEPGLINVSVQIWDALFAIMFGTVTDSSGNYLFEGLPSGLFSVQETDPIGYVSTTPNLVAVNLPSAGSADVDFGDQAATGAGEADIAVTKACSTLVPGVTGQLAFLITVTNNGPDTAESVILADDLGDLITAGLSAVEYTVDGGAPVVLGGASLALPLGDMLLNDSHVIRIYADVSPTFTPLSNTAMVSSSTYDPGSGNNASYCTNLVSNDDRRALDFLTGSSAYVTVVDDDALDLGASGTLEAWIYPTAFTADAGIIMKGTTEACYGLGFGGGTLFSAGTSKNICFVIYEQTAGTKYAVAADTRTLEANKWYHIACVWNGSAPGDIGVVISINGVMEKSTTVTLADNVRANSESLIIGIQSVTPESFSGVIDEVRVWDAARTPAQIQNTMCRKVFSTDAGFSNLAGYWRFDENSGPVCGDNSGNGNIGIVTNAVRICSTAPIGDASIPDYEESDGFSVAFANPVQDESLTVSAEIPADWSEALKSGLQVYRANTSANDQSGPLGLRLYNDRGYWGVFVTGGTAPTYMIEYNYDVSNDGFPGVGDKNNLRLTWRQGNCENWKNLDATPGVNTLTQTGLTGTEFLLGTYIDPRNTLNFNSANSDYVAVTDTVAGGDLDPTTYGAIEAWINIASYQDNAGIIHKGDGTNDSYSLYMGTDTGANENQYVYFTVDAGGGTSSTIHSTYPLNLNTWYHIAGTWDDVADTMMLYINGVQDQDVLPSATVTAQETDNDLFIGVRPTGGAGYFNGNIDEVRVWHITAPANMRTRTLIRDTMCRKLTGSETDLGAYWRFDEETGSNICPDYSGKNHPGTLSAGFGADGSDAVRSARVCSSAPIGDGSAYDYYDGGAAGTVSAQLAHLDGDYMFGTQSAGTWNGPFSGIQLYRVDEAPVYPPDLWTTAPYTYQTPNGLTPPAGPPVWSSIDYYRYWGVFVTDWDAVTNQPVYDAVYHYAGNPSVPVDDSVVGLARRPAYCFGTWTDSGYVLDYLVNNTLTVSGESQYGPPATNPEYVLGGKDAPLAIVLANFKAEIADGCVHVIWETATEIDTAGFYLWRSNQKNGVYTRIEGSFTRSEALTETMGAAYEYVDCDADVNAGAYYYKLEEVDLDNANNNPFYGPIGPVTQTVSAARPTGGSDSKTCFIDAVWEY